MIRLGKRKVSNASLTILMKRTGGNYIRVMERDNYRCVVCGRDDGFLVVHHKDGNVMNNDMDNLMTVCKPCHARLHHQTLRFNKPTVQMVTELRLQGKTYQQIGEYLGISRQRVHQIVKRAKELAAS